MAYFAKVGYGDGIHNAYIVLSGLKTIFSELNRGQLDSRCTRCAPGKRVHRVFCFTEPEPERRLS
jgi:hypothetical protein